MRPLKLIAFSTWLSCALCFITNPALAQTPVASPTPSTVLVVNYMKVKGDVVALQRDLWIPIHQEAVKTGTMAFWSSWRINWAAKNSEYDFLTVDGFKDWAAMGKPAYTRDTWAKIHPGKSLEDISKRTTDARDIVRRDVLALISATTDVPNAAPLKYVIVDFYQATPGKTRDYVALERETYLPMHQEAVKQGKLLRWQFYRVLGAGSENSYNFVTVRGYSKWEDIGSGGGNAVLAKVHPNLKPEDLAQRVMAARTLAKSQLMTLVDQVPPIALTANK